MIKLILYSCVFAVPCLSNCMTAEKIREKIDYSSSSITYDSLAEVVKPTPLSVSGLIALINKKLNGDVSSLRVLDLSGNFVCIEGATKILQYAANNLVNLRKLDLAYNNIEGKRKEKDYQLFEEALIKVLTMPSVKIVDLAGSFTKKWYDYFSRAYPELVKKVVWKNIDN